MSNITPQLLKGFRDYLPGDMIPRQRMIERVRAVFERYGYSPLETPALEYASTLLGKYGSEGEKQLYRFTDNGEREVGLRFDLTVPLARVVAMYQNDITLPFKRYQIQPVWRAEKPQKGRFREFYQCDVDAVGATSMIADAECIQIACDVLTELGVEEFTVKINNRKVLNGFFEATGITTDQLKSVFIAIDKLPKIGVDAVNEELTAAGLTAEQQAQIIAFAQLTGTTTEMLSRLDELVGQTESGKQGMAELREVVELASAAGVGDDHLMIDPSIARGLEYYSGTVYETFVTGAEKMGSVMSGGRYDELVGMFAGRQIPAIGISLGIDRLFAVLQELGKVSNTDKTTARAVVTIFDENLKAKSVAVAQTLRKKGIATLTFVGPVGDLGKQMKYADKLGIKAVVVIGPEEAQAGKAVLKNLTTGDQMTVDEDSLAAEISAMV